MPDDVPAEEPDAAPAEAPDDDLMGDDRPPDDLSARRPRNPRFNRLRDRWVPEPLQAARVDPGRRGAVLLSLVAAVAAVVAAIGVWSGSSAQPVPPTQPLAVANLATDSPDATTAAAQPTQTESAAPTQIVVAVTGQVRTPGVVTLSAGARVADAIAAAGGILDGVDYTGLNLAAKLADGDSVVVGGGSQGLQAPPAGAVGAPDAAGQLVNLNTADQATLETLPGVGPVMAGNILAWRESSGPFTAIDQLQEITGIGPSRFATLAPLVTI